MNDSGIHDGDLLVVDRSLNAKNFSNVVPALNYLTASNKVGLKDNLIASL